MNPLFEVSLIPAREFARVRASALPRFEKLALIADMCRLNTFGLVKRAGSGHLGSSLSAMDIVVWLYYDEMNTASLGFDHRDRDVYFSSKGHDVPGLYTVLFSLGVIPWERYTRLRRLGGLDGHPDIAVPGIEANSGSLGMGISKGKGIAWAKRHLRRGGRVFVMLGDGELQEGQNYEALLTAVQQELGALTILIDNNRVQSDKPVCEIVDLGDLVGKLEAFGWQVARCNGHDIEELDRTLAGFRDLPAPRAIVADTIKGRGISFMEHPSALRSAGGLYPWHAGAPDDDAFRAGWTELGGRLQEAFASFGLGSCALEVLPPETLMAGAGQSLGGEPLSEAAQRRITAPVTDEYVARTFGEALVELAREHAELVVLDADLAADCRIRGFENTFPDRFIENGIAEQDMVSMAGGLARQGLLPVVNSFASFLAARANEQIYNNNGERSKVIYVCHYAGLIPAGPGKSHQSVRDISLLAALPDFTILQPANADETRWILEWCVREAVGSCAIRLAIGPSPRRIALPPGYQLAAGRGVALTPGSDAVLFAYGPVMLHEALLASELLAERGVGLRVVNMPWLNRVEDEWLGQAVAGVRAVCVLEDHAPVAALGDMLLGRLARTKHHIDVNFRVFGVEGHPACGTPSQALRLHRLDALSLCERILELLNA